MVDKSVLRNVGLQKKIIEKKKENERGEEKVRKPGRVVASANIAWQGTR